MGSEFTVQNRVEFAHTDMGGIVHFSRYATYIEEAEHAWFRSIGHSLNSKIEGVSYGWPRVSCSLEFLAPLKFEDEFSILLKLVKIGNSSFTYEATISKDKMIAAKGQMTTVCCTQSENGRYEKTNIPDVLRACFE